MLPTPVANFYCQPLRLRQTEKVKLGSTAGNPPPTIVTSMILRQIKYKMAYFLLETIMYSMKCNLVEWNFMSYMA